MSNAISSGQTAQVPDRGHASATAEPARLNIEPGWSGPLVFDGRSFTDTWLDTLNLQFGVEK
ncbi:MAG TPA: hypothetical protein VJ577_15380 [Burkholderiaceae bacterium]|nr:hypothetical protein [Burkholderiaceae bacterium]